ncbi:RNA polymerase II transcription factor B subunit 4 [Borealophlyctis nickersoniae]|nr:RNA polymerase II transcription factor B subunit 4 [Borealophlyctis nickersoniae]
MATEDDINILAVIIDTNPVAWARAAERPDKPLHFTKALEQLLVFINAHLALRFDNQLAVIASHFDRSQFLYPPPPDAPPLPDQLKKPANVYKHFKDVDDRVVATLKAMVKEDMPENVTDGATSMIAGSMSLALSYINRIRKASENHSTQSRILIISISPDASAQYIPIMNSIFAAQKQGIHVDVCRFKDPKRLDSSVFLQQAADITQGIYLEPPEPQNLIQYLLVCTFCSEG